MKCLIIFSSTITLLFLSCKSSKEGQSTSQISGYSVRPEFMDLSVSPKDDFFTFCNGSWSKINEIPDAESKWGSFNELDQNNKTKLTVLLEDAQKNNQEKGSDKQILGDYYTSFLDMTRRNEIGYSGISTELSRIDAINRKDFLVEVIAKHHSEGVSANFNFGVRQDMKNVNMNACFLGQGGIGLPNKEYYLNENKKELLKAYEAHIVKSFELIGYSQEQAIAAARMVVKFETRMAKAMYSPAEMRQPEKTYNKKSFSEVLELVKPFDMRYYLNLLEFSTPDSIIVSNPPFMQDFAKMIEEENLESWKSYLKWKVIRNYAKHLDQKFVDLSFDFYGKILSGKKVQKPVHEQAIDEITSSFFSEILGKLFIEKHFSKEAKNKVNTLVDNLLLVFRERINKLDWMTPETKEEAVNKLNSIGRKLGFPDQWEDFSKLTISPTDYLQNIKNISLFATKKNFSEYGKAVDKKKWGMPAHMVNAYYSPLNNEIAFPAGIMQAPFFDEKAEDAVNYGGIGMVIGHEFTHGFDDMGSKFGADGTFKNWWSDEDRKSFEERTKILGETFSTFCPIEGHCVNPELTMGENIADLGGLTMAYYAYTLTEDFKRNSKVGGFTPAQRFFIAYGQLWKIKYRDEELKKMIATDPHSPGMYRVNGPLKNCPEFFQAFSVQEGDKMRNKDAKVSKIW
ncbi:MAG: hypothetical protein RL037_280 [Bacteroidota bacterium]